MSTYYFMVGIPGSGKSTYAESLGCKIVCPDTIRVTKRVGSPEAFAIARQEIKSALEAGEDVVFDATNTLRSYRAEMINAGKPFAVKVICVWMDVPLEICVARHLERMKLGVRTTLPISVIERMANQLADNPPDISEGFGEIQRKGV
jgi:predicted kinase